MAKKPIPTGINVTREKRIEALNEHPAGEELQPATKLVRRIDYVGRMSGATLKPLKSSSDPIAMLRGDLGNERELVGYHRERIWQANGRGSLR